MRAVTKQFFESIIDRAIISYTKNRFISEDEIDDLKESVIEVLKENIFSEDFDGVSKFTVVFDVE